MDISVADAGIDDVGDVTSLLAQYGSPLYIVSERTLRTRFRTFRDTFTAPGIDTVVAYSYKTNYLPAVCSILHQEGAWAEVVSGMEYDLARSLGVPGQQIIFNGPYKRANELESAITDGALVNVDSFDELDLLISIAEKLKQTARIGLRINFQHGQQSWTKFGFSADNGDSTEALHRVKNAGRKLQLESLQNHSGTFQVNPEIYARAVQVLSDVAKRARKIGLMPHIVDFGGGYPSGNRLKQTVESTVGIAAGQHLKPFAEAIIGGVDKAREAFGEQPVVVLEPGRAVVDAAMKLACTVVARKSIPGQGEAVIVDAGVNLLPTAYLYDHAVNAVAGGGISAAVESGPVAVFGPLCMQTDVLRDRVILPQMSIGSTLIVSNVGAYTLTHSMQFIQPRPAVVLLGPNGPELIRRRERREDVFSMDNVPSRLKLRFAQGY